MFRKIRTMKDFIAFVLETEISEAKEWVNDFKTSVIDELWQQYLVFPFTRLNVIAFAVAIRIQVRCRLAGISSGDFYNQTKEKTRIFLKEIYQKATQYGIDVDLKEIDWLTDAEKEQAKRDAPWLLL